MSYQTWRERQRLALQVQEYRGNRKRRRHRRPKLTTGPATRDALADVKVLPKPSPRASVYCTIGGHARCCIGGCDCPCHSMEV